MEEKYQSILEDPETIDSETLISIKNNLTRLFWSKHREDFDLEISEIDTDDYYYVLDAINLKYGKAKARDVSNEIEKYLENFLGIFIDNENADFELKQYIGELIGKSNISRDDFGMILDLFKKELYVKKLELLYDQKSESTNTLGKDRYPAGSHYKFFEENYGITKEQIDSAIEENPELKPIYYRYLSSFYTREYEKTYLSMLVDSYDAENKKLFDYLVRNKIANEQTKKINEMFGTRDYTKEPLQITVTALRMLINDSNYNLNDKFENALKKAMQPRTGSPWKEHENFIKKEIERHIRLYFKNVVSYIKDGRTSNDTIVSYIEKNIKVAKKSDLAAVYEFIERRTKSIFGGILEELTEKKKATKFLSIDKKIEEKFRQKAESEAREIIDFIPQLLYRVNKNGVIIQATNPERRIAPQIHIGDGSAREFETPYISTTNLFSIMSTYLYSYDPNNPESAFDHPRASSLVIDIKKLYEIMRSRRDEIISKDTQLLGEDDLLLELCYLPNFSDDSRAKLEERIEEIASSEKISEYRGRNKNISEDILDFSRKEEIDKREKELVASKRSLKSSTTTVDGKEKKLSFSRNFAEASAEVLIKSAIPSEVVTEIDPIFMDILLLTQPREQEKFIYNMVQKKIDITNILGDFFSNQENINEDFGLNEHELYFLIGYYINKRPINELLSVYKYKKGEHEVLYDQAMRTNIINKLIVNEKFREMISTNGVELPNELVEHEIVPAIGVSRHAEGNINQTLEDKKIRERAIINDKKISIYYRTNDKGEFTRATGEVAATNDELKIDTRKERVIVEKGGAKQKNSSFTTSSSANKVLANDGTKTITLKIKKPFEKKEYSAIEAAKALLELSKKYKGKNVSKGKKNTPGNDEMSL